MTSGWPLAGERDRRSGTPAGRPPAGVPPGTGRLAGGPVHGTRYPVRVATLSRADAEHVAYLARLGLSDEELTVLEGQLNHILDQYLVLAQLDTDAIPPTAQTIELENILREDTARPSLDQETVLSGAPEREGEYFRVPVIVEGGEG